jgi:hypothetical protein
VNKVEDRVKGRYIRFEKGSDDVEVNGLGTLVKTINGDSSRIRNGTNSGARQNEKYEDDRF